jgi:hypothetical protein
MPGTNARTIEIAKRMLFNDDYTNRLSTTGINMTPGDPRRYPIQQEFPERLLTWQNYSHFAGFPTR